MSEGIPSANCTNPPPKYLAHLRREAPEHLEGNEVDDTRDSDADQRMNREREANTHGRASRKCDHDDRTDRHGNGRRRALQYYRLAYREPQLCDHGRDGSTARSVRPREG